MPEHDLIFLLDELPTAVVASKADDGMLLYANKKASEFFGTTWKENIGKPAATFWNNAEDRKIFVDILQRDSFVNDFVAILKIQPDTNCWCSLSSRLGFFEGHQAIITCVTDIALRKKLEDDLQVFRKAIQSSDTSIIITNRNGDIEYVNPRFSEITGYGFDEVAGKNPRFLKDPAKPSSEYKDLWDTILAGKSWRGTMRNVKKDGSYFWEAAVISPVTDSSGNITHFVGVKEDITESRRMEQLLKSSFERKRRNDVLNELIRTNLPSKQVLSASARIMGMKISEPFTCYVLSCCEYKSKTIDYWLERPEHYQYLLESIVYTLEDQGFLAFESPDGISVLTFGISAAETTKENQIKLAEELLTNIHRQVPDASFSIGVSELAPNLSDIATHYRQAAISVSTGCKIWPHLKIFHYLDIGVFQVLPCFTDQKEIDSYIDRTLGKLLHYDKKKKDEFLTTLEFIIASDNLKEAADMLSIHYKTLMFRKHRLEEILEVSLDNFVPRMAIATAVHLMKLRK